MDTYDTLIRVSKMNGRKESADSTMTLNDQRNLIDSELGRIGGRRGKTFEALDQSGFTVLESPVIEQILARAESGASTGLVIAYGDRMARNSWHLGTFFGRMEKAGAEIHDASMPGIDYRTPEGRQLTMMRGVSSEGVYFAAKRRGDNVADGVVARGVHNAIPYGYRRNAVHGVKTDPAKDAKTLVPHEEHARIVKRIFALRLQGQRAAAIQRTLNEAGVPSPRGKRWTDSSIETILRNEVYTGLVKLGRRRNEGAHAALVSKSDWKRAQATRAVTLSGTYRAGVAGGLVVCSGCGRPLGVMGHPGRLTYSCRGSSSDGRCPRRMHISKDTVDAFVDATVADALDSRTLDVFASSRELDEAKQLLDSAQEAKAAVLAKADVLSNDELEAALQPKRQAEEAARQAYHAALTRAEATVELPTTGSAYRALSETGRRRTAQSLIERIVVEPPLPGGTVDGRLSVVYAHGG